MVVVVVVVVVGVVMAVVVVRVPVRTRGLAQLHLENFCNSYFYVI